MTRIPDSFVPIIGWRAWSINDKGQLTSQCYDTTAWEPGKPLHAVHREDIFREGSIRKNDGPFCGDGCFKQGDSYECGIHAFKEAYPLDQMCTFIGEVELWGIVRVHEWGYRAEYGYPRSFHITDGANHVRDWRECLQSFNIPTTVYESLTERRNKLCPNWEKEYQRYLLSVSKDDLRFRQAFQLTSLHHVPRQTNPLANLHQQHMNPLASGIMALQQQYIQSTLQNKPAWKKILNLFTGV